MKISHKTLLTTVCTTHLISHFHGSLWSRSKNKKSDQSLKLKQSRKFVEKKGKKNAKLAKKKKSTLWPEKEYRRRRTHDTARVKQRSIKIKLITGNWRSSGYCGANTDSTTFKRCDQNHKSRCCQQEIRKLDNWREEDEEEAPMSLAHRDANKTGQFARV